MADVVQLSAKMAAKVDAEQDVLDDCILRSRSGEICACEHNAALLIAANPHYAELHFDDFFGRQRLGSRDWTDADDLQCVRWLQWEHKVPGFKLVQAQKGALAVAYERRRDSLREFVETIPEWDGVPRIETAFINAWGAPDNALMRAASQNFFVALIARAVEPGAKVDTLWTFEGPQGIGKSRALEALGGPFRAEISAAIGSTDFMREMRGVWIAELSELDCLRGREASTIKRLLSTTEDRFVQKYALHAERYRRRAVAVATTNEIAYWQDSTGARRLIPIACTTIDVEMIAADRLQWIAEAKQLYADGCRWWEFPDSLADEQEERQDIDLWEDMLRGYMAHGRRSGIDSQGVIPWPSGWIATTEITRDWLNLPPDRQGRASSKRLGSVMKHLGYVPRRRGNPQERGWEPADTSWSADDEGV